MSKQTDLREIQRLTEDAAIDARKLLIQADNLPPGTFQKMLEELCGSFEDTALQLRRLCEQQSPGTGGYKRGCALRPLEVVGSVERIGIDWLHIRINTLLPHCRFQPPTWLTETLVELLDAYEACGGQLPHFNSALLVIEEYSDVDGRHIFDQDNKGWKAVSNAIKGRVIPDDDQYTLSVGIQIKNMQQCFFSIIFRWKSFNIGNNGLSGTVVLFRHKASGGNRIDFQHIKAIYQREVQVKDGFPQANRQCITGFGVVIDLRQLETGRDRGNRFANSVEHHMTRASDQVQRTGGHGAGQGASQTEAAALPPCTSLSAGHTVTIQLFFVHHHFGIAVIHRHEIEYSLRSVRGSH